MVGILTSSQSELFEFDYEFSQILQMPQLSLFHVNKHLLESEKIHATHSSNDFLDDRQLKYGDPYEGVQYNQELLDGDRRLDRMRPSQLIAL